MGLYLVQSLKGANLLAKLLFIFLLLALLLGWVAYSTGSWYRVENQSAAGIFTGYGVWRVGHNAEPVPSDSKNPTQNIPSIKFSHADGWLLEWYGGFQVCATVGFVCLNVGFFLVVLFIFVTPCKSNADLAFWNAIINIVGSIFWLIAVILFAVKSKEDLCPNNSLDCKLHYSFVFAIFTFAFQLAAGIVLLLTKRGGGAVSTK